MVVATYSGLRFVEICANHECVCGMLKELMEMLHKDDN